MSDQRPQVDQGFIQGVRDELKKVQWPSRAQVTRLTLVVIIISVVVALYIGGIDAVLAKVLELLTKGK